MAQEILTYIILSGTAIWTVMKLYNTFFQKVENKSQGSCGPSCGGCNSDCSLKDSMHKARNNNLGDISRLKLDL